MPVNSMAEFWKLLVDSRLVSLPQCQQLLAAFEAAYPACAAGVGAPQILADWLVAMQTISRYQASVLLAGRPGPFLYGDYQVYERLEQGPQAGLFRAFHVPTRHPVLLQFATGAITQDALQWSYVANRVQSCLAEPQLHQRRCYEAVDLGNYKFFVSEELAGESVADLVARTGRLNPTVACFLARQAALGLAHLHRWGLAHGDLRPANLWMESTGRLLVMTDPAQLPMPWTPLHDDGTGLWQQRADYVAPEYVQGNRLPDAATDLYSLGCTLYQLLSGQPPFPGGDCSTKARRHQLEAPPSLAAWGIPQPLEQLVAYLIAKDPALRINSAMALAEHLAAWVDPQAIAQIAPTPTATLPLYEQYLASRHGGTAGGPAPVPPTPQLTTPQLTTSAAAVTHQPGSVAITTSGVTASSVPASGTTTAAVKTSGSSAGPAKPNRTIAPKGERKATTSQPNTPVSAPAPGPNSTGMAPAAARATSASSSTAPLVGIPPLAPNVTRPMKPVGQQPNQKLLLIGAGVVGLTIVGLLGAMFMGGGPSSTNEPSGEPLAQAGGTAAVAPLTTAPKLERESTPGKPANPTINPTANVASSAGTKSEKKASRSSTSRGGGEPNETRSTADGPALRQEVLPDNGQLLWASPTQGPAVEFDYVPPGGQLFLIMRPAEMLATSEGPRVLRSLGPNLELAIQQWETASGFRLSDVRQLILTLHDNGEEFPRASLVVQLAEPMAEEDLVGHWANSQPIGDEQSHLYQSSGWTYFIPPAGEGRVFVMGAAEDVEKVVKETKGAPPALRREIDKLRRVTDSQRHVSVLLAPNYLSSNLFRDGRKYYFGDGKKIREPLDWFLKDELQAMLFSLHCDTDSFWELRLAANIGKEKLQLATELRDRLAEVPDQALDYIATIGSNPYWERVRLLYPNMIRMMHKMTRVGVEEEMAVVNCVLPPSAAHNLVFGSEMVLASTPGVLPVPTATATTTQSKYTPASMTFDDVMNKYKTTISFEAQSLEFALQDVAKDVTESLKGLPFDFKIVILGDDLKLEGITRNQTVRDFQQKDKTVSEVLTAMVRKANPVTTVQDPSEKDQKLVWVVEKDPENPSKTVVLITTRVAAEMRKYQLPKHFQLK